LHLDRVAAPVRRVYTHAIAPPAGSYSDESVGPQLQHREPRYDERVEATRRLGMSNKPRVIGLRLLTVARAVGAFVSPRPAAAASSKVKTIVFEANTKFRTFKQVPGQDARPETGEITGAGVMNSSFETITDNEILLNDGFDFDTLTGTIVLRHTDRYKSKNSTHVDSTGVTHPDSFDVRYTIVGVGVVPQHLRVTFNGQLSEGTGMFAGATGVLNGHGNQVASSDPEVALAFEGKVGGEINPPGG
jgi:hypothetical protein